MINLKHVGHKASKAQLLRKAQKRKRDQYAASIFNELCFASQSRLLCNAHIKPFCIFFFLQFVLCLLPRWPHTTSHRTVSPDLRYGCFASSSQCQPFCVYFPSSFWVLLYSKVDPAMFPRIYLYDHLRRIITSHYRL